MNVPPSMYVPCFWISLDIASNIGTFPEFDGLGAKHVQEVGAPRFELHAEKDAAGKLPSDEPP